MEALKENDLLQEIETILWLAKKKEKAMSFDHVF